jgi:hypothetical protein
MGHLLLQRSWERALIGLAEGADFDNAWPSGRKRHQLQHAWFAGSAGSGTTSDAASHRWAECSYLPAIRAAVVPRAPGDRPRRRALLGRRSCSWAVLPLLRHDAFTRGSVLTHPGGLEWDLPVDRWPEKSSSPMRSPLPSALRASGSLALIACPRPSSGDVGEGLVTTASALRSSLLLFGRPERRSLSLLSERAAVSRSEFVVPRASWYGGCSYPRERNRSPVCNGTLSDGVCSLRLSGPEHLCIWA